MSGKSKQPYSRDIRQGSQPPSQPASILGHTDSLAVGKVLPQMKTWKFFGCLVLKNNLSGKRAVFDVLDGVVGGTRGQSSSSSAQCSTPSHHNDSSKHWPEL